MKLEPDAIKSTTITCASLTCSSPSLSLCPSLHFPSLLFLFFFLIRLGNESRIKINDDNNLCAIKFGAVFVGVKVTHRLKIMYESFIPFSSPSYVPSDERSFATIPKPALILRTSSWFGNGSCLRGVTL